MLIGNIFRELVPNSLVLETKLSILKNPSMLYLSESFLFLLVFPGFAFKILSMLLLKFTLLILENLLINIHLKDAQSIKRDLNS